MTSSVLIVDNGSRSTQLITRLAEEAGWSSRVVPFDVIRPQPWPADAVILTGTDLPVFAPGYEREIELVLACEAPLLGICGGMQLIGRAHGVGLDKGEPVIGRTEVKLYRGVGLFDGMPDEVSLFQRHVYRLREVPPGFEAIATSSECPIEGIRQLTRPVYGMQAHLEFRTDGRAIFHRFLRLAEEWT